MFVSYDFNSVVWSTGDTNSKYLNDADEVILSTLKSGVQIIILTTKPDNVQFC